MIKVNTKNGNFEEFELKGTYNEIVADINMIIHKIYLSMQESNEKEAECFKQYMIEHIDFAFKSPREAAIELLKQIFNKADKSILDNLL